MKTKEEIQKLKDNWSADPCWDIENTEGFEEHKAELLEFRKDLELAWETKEWERLSRRRSIVAMGTGILDADLADCLFTFSEIENNVAAQDNHIADGSSKGEIAKLELMQAQIRATLLLAAQIKRVADLLGEKLDRDAGESNQDFMTRLYTPSK